MLCILPQNKPSGHCKAEIRIRPSIQALNALSAFMLPAILKRPEPYLVTQPLRIPTFQGPLSKHSSSRTSSLQSRVSGRSLAIDSSRTEASYSSTLGAF